MTVWNKKTAFKPQIATWGMVALLSGWVVTSCSKDDGGDPKKQGDASAERPPEGQEPKDGLSLSVPQEKWQASHFCGDIKPVIPEDPTPEHRFETSLLSEKLSGAGLTGWVHGAVPMYNQYVFTYRKEDPNDFMAFFKAQQFSLIPADAEVAKAFTGLKRHDKVRLRGAVFENGSALVHIRVTALEMVKKYDLATENTYGLDVNKLGQKPKFDLFGIVHAIAHSDQLGYAVVVENKDLILPIAISPNQAEAASKLYRGDIINIPVSVIPRKSGPPHLVSDEAKEFSVVDAMLNCHGQERSVTGTLVKFEKSPAISTDVYAVRIVDGNGIGRNFTFFPASEEQEAFTNVFMGISAKAKAAWEKSSQEARVVRNFREKSGIRVVAKGRLNVVSLEQANAQVYINSADDVSFELQ